MWAAQGQGSAGLLVGKSREADWPEAGSEQGGRCRAVLLGPQAGSWQAARCSWPLLLGSDLAQLVCLVSRAWPLCQARWGDGSCASWLGLTQAPLANQRNWFQAERTRDVPDSLGTGQRKRRAQGPRRHPGSPSELCTPSNSSWGWGGTETQKPRLQGRSRLPLGTQIYSRRKLGTQGSGSKRLSNPSPSSSNREGKSREVGRPPERSRLYSGNFCGCLYSSGLTEQPTPL